MMFVRSDQFHINDCYIDSIVRYSQQGVGKGCQLSCGGSATWTGKEDHDVLDVVFRYGLSSKRGVVTTPHF